MSSSDDARKTIKRTCGRDITAILSPPRTRFRGYAAELLELVELPMLLVFDEDDDVLLMLLLMLDS